MELIGEHLKEYQPKLFDKPTKGVPRNYRENIITTFLDDLNKHRGNRKPIAFSRFLKRLKDAGFDTKDKEAIEIKEFWREAHRSGNFSKFFWGITKWRIAKIKAGEKVF